MNRLSYAFFATALLLAGFVLAAFILRASEASFARTPAGSEKVPSPSAAVAAPNTVPSAPL